MYNKQLQLSNPIVAILSAELSNLSPMVNAVLTDELELMLRENKQAYKKVKGFYKGVAEESFLVANPNIPLINKLAFDVFKQESFLLAGADRKAYLWYPTDFKHLGTLRLVDKEIAEKFDSYTESDGYFYVAY